MGSYEIAGIMHGLVAYAVTLCIAAASSQLLEYIPADLQPVLSRIRGQSLAKVKIAKASGTLEVEGHKAIARVIKHTDANNPVARTVIIQNSPEAHRAFGVRNAPIKLLIKSDREKTTQTAKVVQKSEFQKIQNNSRVSQNVGVRKPSKVTANHERGTATNNFTEPKGSILKIKDRQKNIPRRVRSYSTNNQEAARNGLPAPVDKEHARVIQHTEASSPFVRTVIIQNTAAAHRVFGVRNAPNKILNKSRRGTTKNTVEVDKHAALHNTEEEGKRAIGDDDSIQESTTIDKKPTSEAVYKTRTKTIPGENQPLGVRKGPKVKAAQPKESTQPSDGSHDIGRQKISVRENTPSTVSLAYLPTEPARWTDRDQGSASALWSTNNHQDATHPHDDNIEHFTTHEVDSLRSQVIVDTLAKPKEEATHINVLHLHAGAGSTHSNLLHKPSLLTKPYRRENLAPNLIKSQQKRRINNQRKRQATYFKPSIREGRNILFKSASNHFHTPSNFHYGFNPIVPQPRSHKKRPHLLRKYTPFY